MKSLYAEEGLFHGHEVYLKYREKGLRPGQCIRAYDYGMGSGDEPRFAVGLEGRLYDQNREEVFPKDVLNGRDGWYFDGEYLDLLPDDVIREYMKL